MVARMSVINKEDYSKKNIQFAKIYFFLLILFQLIGLLVIIFYVRDILTIAIIAFFITIILPIILGLSLINYYKKRE